MINLQLVIQSPLRTISNLQELSAEEVKALQKSWRIIW